MSDPRKRMLEIKIQAGRLLDRAPLIGELRALRRKERKLGLDMAEAQRKVMKRLTPLDPMPTPLPKICCECKEPGAKFIPTKDVMLSHVLHPMFNLWSRDKAVIESEFAKHHERFKYKWFCRTHGLAFIARYNASH